MNSDKSLGLINFFPPQESRKKTKNIEKEAPLTTRENIVFYTPNNFYWFWRQSPIMERDWTNLKTSF